ncbi:unnamed protein product, partial [Owenia fusiformis]
MFVIRGMKFSDYYRSYGEEKMHKGDHDFVVIHRKGIMFIQVKSSSNVKNKRKVKSKANKQLEKDKKMLEVITKNIEDKDLAKEMQSLLSNGYHLQLVTATPNLNEKSNTVNSETKRLYQEDVENDKAFSDWWDRTTGDTEDFLSDELYNFLSAKYIYIRHLTHEGNNRRPAALTSQAYEDIASKLTSEEWLLLIPEQLNLLNDETRFKYIDGPPGSGKTQILVLKVRKILETNPNDTILIITVGEAIAMKIELDLQQENLRVTVKSVDPRANYPEGGETKYNHIFIDESQDILKETISYLQENIIVSKTEGFFWLFLDKAQILQEYSNTIGEDFLYRSKTDAYVPELKTIMRMTSQTTDNCKAYDTMDRRNISVGHNVVGPEVKIYERYSPEFVLSLIDQTEKHHTTILFENDKDILNFKEKCDNKYYFQNAKEKAKNCSNITLDTIRNFRGLEDKVVIVCFTSNLEDQVELVHIACSRSYCSLFYLPFSPKKVR